MSSTDDSVSPSSRSGRFKRLRLGAIALGVLVILAFAGSSAYDAWRAYHNALGATDRELGNVANALAEQTAWTWQGIDLLLRDTARWFQNDARQIAPARLGEVLANRTAGVRQGRLLTIVEAPGIQRSPLRDPPRGRAFATHRGRPRTIRGCCHGNRRPRRSQAVLCSRQPRRRQCDPATARGRDAAGTQPADAERGRAESRAAPCC